MAGPGLLPPGGVCCLAASGCWDLAPGWRLLPCCQRLLESCPRVASAALLPAVVVARDVPHQVDPLFRSSASRCLDLHRENALAKDSEWVRKRKALEETKAGCPRPCAHLQRAASVAPGIEPLPSASPHAAGRGQRDRAPRGGWKAIRGHEQQLCRHHGRQGLHGRGWGARRWGGGAGCWPRRPGMSQEMCPSPASTGTVRELTLEVCREAGIPVVMEAPLLEASMGPDVRL